MAEQPAYLIAAIDIADRESYQAYVVEAVASFRAVGGEALAISDSPLVLEGDNPGGRFVIIRFPSLKVLRDWYASERYTKARAIRHAHASTAFLLGVSGLDHGVSDD